MSEWRVAFAGETPEEPLEWRVVSEGGDIRDRGAGHLDAFARTRGEKTALVLPGMMVSCLTTALAARNERQARIAAPFAIEDDLATELDSVHVALLDTKAERQPGIRTLFVVDGPTMGSWTEAFNETGLKLSRIVPDYMCLRSIDGQISIALAPRRAIVRAGQWGTAIDEVLGQTVLDAVLEAKTTGRTPEVVANTSHSSSWPSAHFHTAGTSTDTFDLLARGVASSGLNMLQGAYAARPESVNVGWNKWVAPATAAAAALGLMSATNFYEGITLNGAANAVKTETATLFQQAFPEVERVVNPRAQLRAMSASGTAGDPDFLVLSSFLAAGLQSAEGVSIDSVRFDSARQEISASVLFNSYEALADFRTAIEAAGGVVEEGGSRQAGSRRSGELKVRRS